MKKMKRSNNEQFAIERIIITRLCNLYCHPVYKLAGRTKKKKYRLRGRSSETAKAHRG
eukprot:TRINITY_DN29_c0_g1_i2.p1 TRINITY_DN29_c0_g1~~TRINITY_DN29_c0_g1_i2.p1  ORF type:complete len:58 (+),score=27.52 TRINITY_DN29_c0_g1_i2:100-273(+)